MITEKNFNKKWIFSAIALNAIVINADASIANLAIPTIAKAFHSPLSTLQWVISIYLLLGVPMLIFSGKLADIFGKKNIYIFGTIVFVLGSLICGLAHTIVFLIIGRAVQGFAFGFLLSLGLVLLTANYPKERWGVILGLPLFLDCPFIAKIF